MTTCPFQVFALDERLVNYLSESRHRRNLKLRIDILGEKQFTVSKHPIPISPHERQKIESLDKLTIPELQKKIVKLVVVIPDQMQLDYHQHMYEQEFVTKVTISPATWL